MRRLKSLVVDLNFQGRLLAIFALFGLFQALVNYYTIYFVFQQIREAAYTSGMQGSSALIDYLALQEFYIHTFVWTIFTISFATFLFVGVRFSHQAAGALHRLKSEFTKMKKDKKLHPVRLRKTDFFGDVAESFNELATELEDQGGKTDRS